MPGHCLSASQQAEFHVSLSITVLRVPCTSLRVPWSFCNNLEVNGNGNGNFQSALIFQRDSVCSDVRCHIDSQDLELHWTSLDLKYSVYNHTSTATESVILHLTTFYVNWYILSFTPFDLACYHAFYCKLLELRLYLNQVESIHNTLYLSCRFSSQVAIKSRNIWDMHTCSFQCSFSWIQVEIVWWIFTECRVWRYMYWLKCYWTSWPGIFHFMCKSDQLRADFVKWFAQNFGQIIDTYPHPLSGADKGSG